MGTKSRSQARMRRHRRVRRKVRGTGERPRMSVCLTSKHIYVQFIDDDRGVTLASVSSLTPEFRSEGARCNVDGARRLGRMAAERALSREIRSVVLDRGGFRYQGRLRGIAEAAREAGLVF